MYERTCKMYGNMVRMKITLGKAAWNMVYRGEDKEDYTTSIFFLVFLSVMFCNRVQGAIHPCFVFVIWQVLSLYYGKKFSVKT